MKRTAIAPFCLGLAVLAGAGTARGQEDPGAAPTPSSSQTAPHRDARRLFQRFAEDAAIIPGGWVEGRLSYEHLDDGQERWLLGGLFAFKVSDSVEAGLGFGYEKFDADPSEPDGTGLSDIDLYAKYRFAGGASPCALGGLLKAPTADEEDGLGTGKLDFEAFGACRANLAAVTLTGNLGARYNGSPDAPLPDSQASVLAGGGLILPVGRSLSFVIEASWESERLEGAGNDARLTLGLQGVAAGPGFGFRGAVALPLSDGAPDYQFLFGAVYLY